MKERILLLIKGLDRGGAEHLLLSSAPHFDRGRFQYEVARVVTRRDALVGEMEGYGVRCWSLNGRRGLASARHLPRLIEEREIDLVHIHSPVLGVGARMALRGKVPIVYTEHNLWPRYHPATRWTNLLTFGRNDQVLCVSDHVRESIRYPSMLKGRRMPPVETLHYGIDLEDVKGWESKNGFRKELGISESAPVIGTVAHFKTAKGHADLLEAAVRVRKAIPEAKFVLIGRGPLEEQLRRRADQLGLNGTVVFAGYRQDAPKVMASFDVFALPSLYEGLPIALVEALAVGTPAVVTDAGGNTEVVRHGEEGLVVPKREPERLAASILEVLGNDARRAEMGEKARLRATNFDIRKAVHRQEEIYEELLA